jgi:hypothetical protein
VFMTVGFGAPALNYCMLSKLGLTNRPSTGDISALNKTERVRETLSSVQSKCLSASIHFVSI